MYVPCTRWPYANAAFRDSNVVNHIELMIDDWIDDWIDDCIDDWIDGIDDCIDDWID